MTAREALLMTALQAADKRIDRMGPPAFATHGRALRDIIRSALAAGDASGEKAGVTQASESLANPSPPPPARPEGREALDVPPYIHEAADWLVRELHHREMMGIPHAMPLCVYAIPSWVGRVQKHVDALSALPRARETQPEDVDVRAEDGSGGPGQTQKGNET